MPGVYEDENMNRILILLHEYQRDQRGLLIFALGQVWQNRGLQVSYAYGLMGRPEADLLIPQIDITHTPREYIDRIKSYSHVANRDVIDISKRRISANLLQEDEDYRGPVIVKTDNNCGGRPEYRLSKTRNHFVSLAMQIALPVAESFPGKRMSWRRTLRNYPIYDNLADVPGGVFKNRALVVEKFLPEKEGGRYFIRHYIFLGDRMRSVRRVGSSPFLKGSESVPAEEGLPVPVPVVDLRHQLGMDYGKIDYVIHEGQVVILDVNRTPGIPGKPAATAVTVDALADGIWSLF